MAQTKTIDITPAKIKMPVIEVSQFDVGRPIIIHMKDGAEWYDLTGLTVKLQGTKPSGFGYSVTGVVSGHDVTFTTTYDMTSEAGFIASEVSIIDGTDVIGSQNAMLHVEQSPHLPEVVDGSPETILPEMRELVNRAEAAAEILLDCSAVATTLPAGSSATASYSPETGVFSFGLPRGEQGEAGPTGADGADGEDGVSIVSVTKTATQGLVDTYTILYSNNNTSTFQVTNGQNGTGSGTVTSVSTGKGLTGGPVTSSGTIKADLVSETNSSRASETITSTEGRQYAVNPDSNGKLSVNVPWTDTNTTYESKTAVSGGTEVSLVTTGEKYTWNQAEPNVQANWNETSSSSDAYIQNKPTIPSVSSITVSLIVANWSNSSQTVTATGVTASNNVVVSPAPSSIDDYVSGGIKCTAQASNSLTFTCTTTPTTAISVNVLIVS